MAARWRRLPSARPSGEPSAKGISEVIDRFAGAVDGRLVRQEAVRLVVGVEAPGSR